MKIDIIIEIVIEIHATLTVFFIDFFDCNLILSSMFFLGSSNISRIRS